MTHTERQRARIAHMRGCNEDSLSLSLSLSLLAVVAGDEMQSHSCALSLALRRCRCLTDLRSAVGFSLSLSLCQSSMSSLRRCLTDLRSPIGPPVRFPPFPLLSASHSISMAYLRRARDVSHTHTHTHTQRHHRLGGARTCRGWPCRGAV